jgi:hypothetical protein
VEVLIDLDSAPPPATTGRRPRLPRFQPRLLLVCAVLLALVVPAAAAPTAAPLTRLSRLHLPGASAYLLRGGMLYAGDDISLAAYQLPSGRPRWRSDTGGSIQSLTAVPAAGALVALVYHDKHGTRSELAGFDTATGAPLWRRSDLAGQPVPGTGKLLAVRYGRDQAGSGQQMLLLDARTGAVGWQRSAPAGGALIPAVRGPDGNGPVLAVARDAGLRVEVFDVVSGATVAAGALADRVSELGRPLRDYTVNLVGRVLVVVAVDDVGASTAYGFDAATLAPRWRTPLAGPALYVTDCAPVICLYGLGGTVTLDPAGGAPIGSADWRDVTPLTPEWLLAQRDTEEVVGPDLVSALDLRGWRAVGGGARTVLSRPAAGATGTWVALLDTAAPAVRPLGLLPVTAVESATTDGRYLACRVAGADLTIYALR